MNKTAKIKNYESSSGRFVASNNAITKNLSHQVHFYTVLFDALTYKLNEPKVEGFNLPNISDSWISETINSKIPMNRAIFVAAQRKDAAADIGEYFRENLIPNISSDVKSTVLARIHALVENDSSLGTKALKSLKRKKDSQAEHDYLAMVWIKAVLLGNDYNSNKSRDKAIVNNIEPVVDNVCVESTKKITVESVPLRNDLFYGRFSDLDKIHKVFTCEPANMPKVTTICGLGGMGKSQLALEYAHIHLKSKLYDIVCWVDCANEEAIIKSCCVFNVQAGEANDENVLIRFANWFHHRSNWLLILDDVDEETNIEQLMPKMGEGHIIITTRLSKGGVVRGTPIELRSMPPEDATAFLLKRTKLSDVDGAGIIANRLGYLPLALEQAGAYIDVLGILFSEYLELLDKYKLEVLDRSDARKDYKWSISTVWNVTLGKLSESAKHLLYCFAYMAAERIEPDWLVAYAKKLKDEQEKPDEIVTIKRKDGTLAELNMSKIWRTFDAKSYVFSTLIAVLTDELILLDALSELIKFSLITTKRDGTYVMHSLFQEVVRAKDTDNTYMLPVFEILTSCFNKANLICNDYRWNSILCKSEFISIIVNIWAMLKLKENIMNLIKINYSIKFSDSNGDNFPYHPSDFDVLQLQFHSMYAQLLQYRGMYEEADIQYKKSIEIAIPQYVGQNLERFSTKSFIVIQEYHRRLRVNLRLNRVDKAKEIYESSKQMLNKFMQMNSFSGRKIQQAFINYAELWKEFKYFDFADEACNLANQCEIIDNYE